MKHRFHSLVNILGLAAGIAFTFLIAAYSRGELQVNTALREADQQYILQSRWKKPDMGLAIASPAPLAKALREEYPGLVANYYRFDGVTSTVSAGDKVFRESLQIGDSTLLALYGFPLLYGNEHALDAPYTVVLTAEMALKYFGTTAAMGKTVTISNFSGQQHDFLVTGVMKTLPANSVTALNDNDGSQFFLPLQTLDFFNRSRMDDWNNTGIVAYVQLQQGIKPAQLEGPLMRLVQQNTTAGTRENLQPYLVQLKKYYREANNGMVSKMVTTLLYVAAFILLMAIVNYINIAVSRSSARMKEIGISKVLGSSRRSIALRFLAESLLLVTVATFTALALYATGRELFSYLLGKPLPDLRSFPVSFLLVPLVTILLVSLLAGSYPAFVLASLPTADSLKGRAGSIQEKTRLRKGLVGVQCILATVVFTGAVVVAQQVSFFFGKSLGYNKEAVLSAQVPRNWSPKGVAQAETIRRELAALPQVTAVTLSYEIPDGNNAGSIAVYRYGSDAAQAVSAQLLTTDGYYTQTYGIPLLAGSFFPSTSRKDQVVINRTQAKALGYAAPSDAVGQQLQIAGYAETYTITGVTGDFHFGSMQTVIPPITFLPVHTNNIYRYLSFKLQPGDLPAAIAAIQRKWSQLMPGAPFPYQFMDDTLAHVYRTELQLKQAGYLATALAILIVVSGIMGLVSVSIQQRTREISIRKILGASAGGIIRLFLQDFAGIILVAGLIACPVAYLLLSGWLQGYSYRVHLTPLPFLMALASLLGIAATLIVAQCFRTAMASPARSLRTE